MRRNEPRAKDLRARLRVPEKNEQSYSAHEMIRRFLRFCILLAIFAASYLLLSAAFHWLAIFVFDRYDLKFGPAGQFQLDLQITAAIFVPLATLLHLAVLLFHRKFMLAIPTSRAALVEVFSGVISAALPGLVLLLNTDFNTLWGGILNASFFFLLMGGPVLSTYLVIAAAKMWINTSSDQARPAGF
jgi:hypothetical protein